MAQRISRAKQAIKASGMQFELPPPDQRAERLRAVRHVLYLIFNEGYTATTGPDLQRAAELVRAHLLELAGDRTGAAAV
jgi:predicted RNA polymerase sigma factor